MTKSKETIDIVKLSDFNFPPEVFIPLRSGKFIDNITSRKGGTMPATITVVVGEPGCVLADTKIIVRKISNNNSHEIIIS